MDNNNLDAMLSAVSWEGKSGQEVRQFLQGFLSRLDSGKIGTHRVENVDHVVTIRSFADDAAAQRWESASADDRANNPEIAALVLGQISFKEATDTSGYTMSVKKISDAPSTVVRGEDCVMKFTYDCFYNGVESDKDTQPGRVDVRINGNAVAELSRDLMPDKNAEVSVNFGKYLTSDRNEVKIVVSDRNGNSRTFTYTVETVQVKLALESFKEEALRNADAWNLQVSNKGNTCTAYVRIDDSATPQSQSIGAGTSMSFVIPKELAPGAHRLEVWGEIEDRALKSSPIVVHFIKAGRPAVCIGAEATVSVPHYGDISIPFFIHYPYGTDSAKTVKYHVEDAAGTIVVEEKSLEVDLKDDRSSGMKTLQISTIDSAFSGRDRVKVVLTLSGTDSDCTAEHEVTLTPADIELKETPQYDLHFTASGHNNTDTDKASWLSVGNGVTASLRLSDNFTLGSDSGFAAGAFVIPRGKTLTIDGYRPFVKDVGANNPMGGGGKTVEVELRVRNCTNNATSILRCINGGKGFEVFANRAVLAADATKSIDTLFSDEVRLRIGFVVEGATRNCVNRVPDGKSGWIETSSRKNIAYIYVGGIPARIMEYENLSWQQAEAQCIEIGSAEADVELFAVRVYSKALTFREMIGNFAYDTPLLADKLAIARRNAIFNTEGAVDFQLVREALPTTPHKIWKFDAIPMGKKDWKTCTTEFINPQFDPAGSDYAFAPFICEGHTFALDGTSSLSYPDPFKNWADKYKGGNWRLVIGDREIAITGYSITKGVQAKATEFVDKVNFASSEGIFNILAANMYHDILLGTSVAVPELLTPPQRQQYLGAPGQKESIANVTYRQSLSGFPIIGWRKTAKDGVSRNEFLSIYNFINNKYDPTYFGFDNSGSVEA